ncbi:MAG: Dabb family protein [Synechococcus sp.]|nr:Dabb family protein [Synechococcus sp.]
MANSIHHIVLFTLAETTRPTETQAIINDGLTLLGAIPGVFKVDLGLKARADRDVHIKDYQLALYVHLENEAALDVYGPHANHQEFLQRHKAKWTKVQVVDFFGQ